MFSAKMAAILSRPQSVKSEKQGYILHLMSEVSLDLLWFPEQGPVSVSVKTSYHKILRILKPLRFGSMLQSLLLVVWQRCCRDFLISEHI